MPTEIILPRVDMDMATGKIGKWYVAEGGHVALCVALLRLADDIEFQIRRSRELDETYVETLLRDGAAGYTQFSSDVLRAMWPKFCAACDEALRISG